MGRKKSERTSERMIIKIKIKGKGRKKNKKD